MSATTPGQRFTQLIQQLGLTKNAFAQSIGRTATVVQHLVDERNKPGFDLLNKVLDVYPNVSSDWLILGKGPMLRDTATPELFAAEPTPAPPPMEPIDLTSLATPARRRPAPNGALLQPADIAATVALAAAAHFPPPDSPAASEPAAPPVPAAPPPTAPLPALAVPLPGPPALPDPTYLAAALQAQHLQHQLALAEQRNQHLLEQQALLKQMVELLQGR